MCPCFFKNMPELPEVENTVRGLKKTILDKTIKDVWADTPKIIKKPKSFFLFKKEIIGRKIESIHRKGKNIIFVLSKNRFLLLHLKMTGHPLIGKWELKNDKWHPIEKGPLNDPMNLFIRVLFTFSDNSMMALSDLRKFAKIELTKEEPNLISLGEDALIIKEKNFLEIIQKQKGKIKQVLMNQEVIAGIGNIYADEILWASKINPLRKANTLSKKELKNIFQEKNIILSYSIKLKGDSMSDYRLVTGEKGGYQKEHKAYRRENQNCFNCNEKIKRIKIGGRSAHFCPKCQK